MINASNDFIYFYISLKHVKSQMLIYQPISPPLLEHV
jgi:hypothetical protein